jgi:hypothetical protein
MKQLLSLFCTSLFFLTSIFFLTKCSKEYSYEGGLINGTTNGTAIFTFIGAGSVCTGNVLSGKYYAGTLLTPANTIQLQVNVATIGSYNVSTGSSDGFQFSGSGNFTDTGIQIITLKGIGTPTSEGTFTFTTPIGLGCSFNVPVLKPQVAIASFTLAGAPNACQNIEVDGNYLYGNTLTSANFVVVNVNVTAIGAYTISTDTIDGIYFSGSGTFTKTGAQTVNLIGTGTPQSPNNLTFTPKADSSNCTFNVSILTPQPAATYVLQSGFGNPNPCLYSVTGAYFSSTPLTRTNNVSILVYVTVVGNFSISTNTVNGMSFSYTGTFITLGAQNVILYGNGTPTAAGTFGFIPQIIGLAPLGGASCAFNVTVR